jgi:hypothetical protein
MQIDGGWPAEVGVRAMWSYILRSLRASLSTTAWRRMAGYSPACAFLTTQKGTALSGYFQTPAALYRVRIFFQNLGATSNVLVPER